MALLVGHCFAIAGVTKGRYSGMPLLTFINGFLMAFGGGVASNLFLGNPTPSVLFQSNQAVAVWTFAWWVVNHNRFAVVDQILDLSVVGISARACLQILRSGLLVTQVEAAAKAFPGIIAPAIIAGTLAACGGKITTDIISTISGLRAPFEVAVPTYALRSALVGSSVYYFTVHVLGALSRDEGHALVLLAFLSHTLSDDLLDAAYDYTTPVINMFTTVTFISGVPAAARGRGRPAAAAAATAAAATAATPSTPRSASKTRRAARTKRSE